MRPPAVQDSDTGVHHVGFTGGWGDEPLTAQRQGTIEQWTVRWRTLPHGIHARVRSENHAIDVGLHVPYPLPHELVRQIEAKLAGRDHEAPNCRAHLELVVDNVRDEPPASDVS